MKTPGILPFNRPCIAGKELAYIAQAIRSGHIAGNGTYTRKCQELLEKKCACNKVLLTHSCTAALEMAAILCDIRPGDEVILPSFTFVSTANAFVLRGARLSFVDIREDTLNMDESLIERAINTKTKVICPVHYAGVGCAMDEILDLAGRRRLTVVEDAAQGLGSTYKGKPLGSFGRFAALSFHETKNIISGEGGALLINDPSLMERAEIVWEKGTNRQKFFRGEVDKYTWVDIGSSFLPSELTAAFLLAQLEKTAQITRNRLAAWRYYHDSLAGLENAGALRLPVVPNECAHNAQLFYILLNSERLRDGCIAHLKSHGIMAVFHYIPLHRSRMGGIAGTAAANLRVTEDLSSRLLRLPLFYGLTRGRQDAVVDAIRSYLK